MKKGFLAIGILLILGLAISYFFSLGKNSILETKSIAVHPKAFSRSILENEKWKNWWPGKKNNNNPSSSERFEYNGNQYEIVGKRFSSMLIKIKQGDIAVLSELAFFPKSGDSVTLQWSNNITTTPENLTKQTKKGSIPHLSKDLQAILNNIQTFYENETNIYGLRIDKKLVTDSNLISTSIQLKAQPNVADIYQMIDKLKAFAKANGANITGHPMLNIYTNDSIHYKAQVALPLDKKLQDKGDIHYRWMLGGGNILVSEVKGGTYTINEGFKAMEHYIADHNRVAPAISFQSLITDRRQEPDTSKWVTKLYWPVM